MPLLRSLKFCSMCGVITNPRRPNLHLLHRAKPRTGAVSHRSDPVNPGPVAEPYLEASLVAGFDRATARHAPSPAAARLLPEDRKPSDQSGDETERMPADLRKRVVGAAGIEPAASAV